MLNDYLALRLQLVEPMHEDGGHIEGELQGAQTTPNLRPNLARPTREELMKCPMFTGSMS